MEIREDLASILSRRSTYGFWSHVASLSPFDGSKGEGLATSTQDIDVRLTKLHVSVGTYFLQPTYSHAKAQRRVSRDSGETISSL